MYYKDIRVWVPDEEILGIRFLKHERFFVLKHCEKPYIIAAEVADSGGLIGFGADGCIYLLETGSGATRYAADALAVFARELKEYRDRDEETDLAEKIKKLDENAFAAENSFWAAVCEETKCG